MSKNRSPATAVTGSSTTAVVGWSQPFSNHPTTWVSLFWGKRLFCHGVRISPGDHSLRGRAEKGEVSTAKPRARQNPPPSTAPVPMGGADMQEASSSKRDPHMLT